MKNQKICIIGDGLSGLTTALALKKLGIEIDLFYKKNIKSSNIDTRVTAISEKNFQFLSTIIKIKNSDLFWPSKKINLFYENKNKYFNFLNFEENKRNMMYIFQNNNLKNVLIKEIKKVKNIKLINKSVEDIGHNKTYIKLKNKKIYYDFIILCLGRKSYLYNNIITDRSIKKDYKETSITCVVRHNLKINGTSQFFLKEGPLAILPFKKFYFSIVWSLDRDFYLKNINNIRSLLVEKLKFIFKKKLKIKISKINQFPIHLNLSNQYYKKNTLILGEGIHSIHPLAGQGFNLILRDIKKIKNLIKKNMQLGLALKGSNILKEFYNSRNPENTLLALGVDLTNAFFKKNKYLEPTKFFLLKNIENFGSIKKISKYVSNKGFF